jgi:GH15 family glucan-1,4-alpha-glucosidase
MSHLLLSDYGLIGNQASAALVSRLGSVDWCCFPFLDSPSHFATLLDESRGGRFQLVPQGDFRSEQRYRQRTHVLETLFETPHGRAVLTDWMPMDPGQEMEPVIHRRIDMVHGKIAWQLTCRPRFSYGEQAARPEHCARGVIFRGESPDSYGTLATSLPLEISPAQGSAQTRFTLEAPQSARFEWAWGRRPAPAASPTPDATVEQWRSWAHHCPEGGCVFAGPWHDAVTRSGLLLKLLIAPYSGSIAEAVTTSLPGVTGGSRTWDYRYAWIRDAALAIQGLSALGYRAEANRYFEWLAQLARRDGAEDLQPVYTLDGGRHLPEREIAHLAGYQGSRPVRVGNQSSRQFHLDIFGHVMVAASQHHFETHQLPDGLWPRLAEIADYVCQAWRRPDQGPWEVRSRPEHFVASKALCWAALDRAISLAERLGETPAHRWAEERAILHRTICDQGFDPGVGSFVRAFGSQELDSATLLLPVLGFLPFDDPRIIGMLDAIQSQLSQGVLIRRYHAGDGMPGAEGAHLPSSFLFVTCLALAGRVDEASDRLAELCTYTTPLGLFGEQVDFSTSEATGNFPSSAVHLSLINAALYVGIARGRAKVKRPIVGVAQLPSAWAALTQRLRGR